MTASHALRIQCVGKTYRSGLHGCTATVRALVDVQLEIAFGEVVAVVGPRGAGKTTLLLCAAGLLTPDAGTIDRRCRSDRRTPVITYLSDIVHANADDSDVVLVDNVDDVRGDVTASFALLYLARRAREHRGGVLLAARDSRLIETVVDRLVRLDHGHLASTAITQQPPLSVRVAEACFR